MTATLLAQTLERTVNDSAGSTLVGSSPLRQGRPGPAGAPELDTLRARLAYELFGVAMEAPRIGRFRVLGLLGAGAMGQVYMAYDEELDRRVAVKVLHGARGELPDGRARMLREAQALARLSHPNVVQIYEVGEHAGHVFVAMEHVRGQNLMEWLERGEGPRGWEAVLAVFLAAGRGLQAAHTAGLVHRDFKPANVIVGDDGRVRVLDFGLARPADEPGESPSAMVHSELSHRFTESLTVTGTVLGTPVYMSPEVLEGQPGDAAADQYAFCAALFEALHGVRPHAGKSLHELFAAKMRGELRSPPAGRDVPRWLHAAIVRGLAVNSAARWPSMAALLDEIGRDRRAARRRGWLATAGVALTGVAVLAGMEAWRAGQDAAVKAAAAEAAALRARQAEDERAVQQARAERALFERETIAAAEQAAEVARLARTPGGQRDALVRGIQLAAAHGPEFARASFTIFDGLADALSSPIPYATLTGFDGAARIGLSPDGGRVAAVDDAGKTLQLWDAVRGLRLWSAAMGGPTLRREASAPEFSGDGSRVLIDGERCEIWRADEGELLLEIGGCISPRFSVDGARVFGALRDSAQSVGFAAWDARSGELLWRVATRGDEEVELLPHGDGARLLVAREGGQVDIHDVTDGRRIAQLPGFGTREVSRVNHLALSHGGGLLGVAGSAGTMQVWDLATGTKLHAFAGGPQEVVFSPEDRRLIGSTWAGFQIFDVASGRKIVELPDGGGMPRGLSGDRVVTVDGQVMRIWDVEHAGVVSEVQAHHGHIRSLALSADRTRLATAGDDGAVRLWRLQDPRVLARWRPPSGESIVAVGADYVATSAADTVVRIYAEGAAKPVMTAPPMPRIFGSPGVARVGGGFAVWPHFAHGPSEWTLYFFDGETGRLRFQYSAELEGEVAREAAYRVGVVPARRSPLIAVDTPESIDVLDIDTGRRRCGIPREGIFHDKLAISDDGAWVAAIDVTGELRAWDTETCAAQVSRSMSAALDEPFDAGLLTGIQAVGASLMVRYRQSTRIYDIPGGDERARLDAACPPSSISRVDVSPDGHRVVTYCEGRGLAWVWDLDAGRVIREFDGIDASGGPLAPFSPGGGELAVRVRGSEDLLIVDPDVETPIVRIRDQTPHGWPNLVAWGRDGETLRVVERDGALYTYPATRAGTIAAACRALAGSEVAAEVAPACSSRP